MEIKKGISQMAEYPNVEVNYVVPQDGNMYYVLKDGALSNGSVIVTMDPKRVIDDSVSCDSIGVFNGDGTVLIDFNKKEIRKINDEYLLVVNAFPTSDLVINALKNENDEISKTMMKDNSTTIVDKMMIEMGITGEILFSDAYSEANIYKVDAPNHKIGPDCSFIGKNDTNFYFRTNDSAQETVVVGLNGEVKQQVEHGFEIPSLSMDEIVETPVENKNEDIFTSDISVEDIDSSDLQLDISQNILDGFKPIEETINVSSKIELPEVNEVENEEEEVTEVPTEAVEEKDVTDVDDEVLDNAIEVVKKMIEETSKLNEKISVLEEENSKLNEKVSNLEEELNAKNKIITSQESKKHTLNDLLEEANEVLENID